MATCKWCGRSGFFLQVSSNGLCPNCEPLIVPEVASRLRVVNDSIELVEKGKTLSTKLSRCDLIIEHATALRRYEEKGIPTSSPRPSEMVVRFQAKRNDLVVGGLLEERRKVMDKVVLATTTKIKAGYLAKLLLTIREYRESFPEEPCLASLENEVLTASITTQLDGFMDEARKAEFKGNNKKALDQYYEALYYIQQQSSADSPISSRAAEVEDRIRALGGTVRPDPEGAAGHLT